MARTARSNRSGTMVRNALEGIEAQHAAILRALPDLFFVIRRDGTYLDYHANNPRLLFAPPASFLGKTIQKVMPRSLTGMFTEAIAHALGSPEATTVAYELPMSGERRSFEARLAACSRNRVVAIVRDVTEMQRAQGQMRNLASRLIVSQNVERMRIARELHDNLGQKVSLLSIGIDRLAESGLNVRNLALSHQRLMSQVAELAHDLSHIAHELHPSRAHALRLDVSLTSLCADFSSRYNIVASFTHGELPTSIDPGVSLCLYRVTQEALQNAFRHSRARHVAVHLEYVKDTLCLRVTDDGVGFDAGAATEGLGLVSMRERTMLEGGTFQIWSKPQLGTRVEATVPLPRRTD